MDLISTAQTALAALAVPALGATAFYYRRAKAYFTARVHIANLQTALARAVTEADRHAETVSKIESQREGALARARAANAARAAERKAKQLADDVSSRDKTLSALKNVQLRPRDEVVADVIRDRTGL